MKKIRFGFSTTELPLSKLIRLFQGINFSHCFIEYESEKYNTTLVYEAKGLNSNIINKENLQGRVVELYEAEVSEELYDQIMTYILNEVGTAYAWKQLFGFIIVKLASLFGKKINNPWKHSGKICSENCGEVLVRFFGITPDVNYDDMDLVWLKEKLIQYPSIFKKVK